MSKRRPNVVNLSVHKNTADQRKRHAMSKQLLNCAKRQAAAKDVAGYAVITWDADCCPRVSWNTGDSMPGFVMPEFLRSVAQNELALATTPDG